MAILYDVDWGDETTETQVSLPRKHNYPGDGAYTVAATRRDTAMQASTQVVIAATGPQITLAAVAGSPRKATLSILSPTRSNNFTVNWGDGKPPSTGVPRGSVAYTYTAKGTYTVTVTDMRTGLAATATIEFAPDFVIQWAVTAEALGLYRLQATITTPPGVDSITARIRTISLGSVTKTGPGQFNLVNVGAASLFSASEVLTITAAGYSVTCTVTPKTVSSGRCEANAPVLGVKHISNGGVLGIGRGTWLTPYAESGVTEIELRWLNSNGTPYDGTVTKISPWKESSNQGYWYGYIAELKLPGTTTVLRCNVGPDGTCTL